MGILIEDVPVRFHPRAFSAFGADLVTNDEVAITELVKNSYDAFATEVTVSISDDEIEIRDNGSGMTRDIIKNAWAVVATPFKQTLPFVEKDGKVRRVSGNKASVVFRRLVSDDMSKFKPRANRTAIFGRL